MSASILLTNDKISLESSLRNVENHGCGAVVTFLGRTRHTSSTGAKVTKIEYEAYEPMAKAEIRAICSRAFETWNVKAIDVQHKVGNCPVGETGVVVAVAAPHRLEAFQACQFVIDQLKATVPIWKEEIE